MVANRVAGFHFQANTDQRLPLPIETTSHSVSRWPLTRSQSGTCIMAKLGTNSIAPRRFFFDPGNGSVKNILGVGVPPAQINDIFITQD
jgi:hypothetical protein